MHIVCPKETHKGEFRVALTPDSARQITKLGFTCSIQKNAGEKANFHNQDYEAADVETVASVATLYKSANIVIKVRPPTLKELESIPEGAMVISHFYPAQNTELLEFAKQRKITVIALDMVPRISRAQRLDVLSSMANISGYRAVIEASNHFGRFFTGQITAAGKVPPAKVLVIGAGVAGLAAIGTAESLGAVVYAFDVRPEVAEQIESMGAEFLFLDFEESGSTDSGYAAPSSPEFQEKQLELFRKIAPDIDIVISTALIPGRDAPKLWLKDMVLAMKPGSVVVDLAAERGGNCDLTEMDKVIKTDNRVSIIGYTDFPSRMATQSSTLYATNVRHILSELTPDKDGKPNVNMEDDVIRGVTATTNGEITFPPPPLKVQAIQPKAKEVKLTEAELLAKAQEAERQQRRSGFVQMGLFGAGTLLMLLLGQVAPASFMQHFSVFVLACFVGYQVIWNVSHSLHTPLMAITNAISGIIIIGALLQLNTGSGWVSFLALVSVLIATINITGGFFVTRRMLKMFQRS